MYLICELLLTHPKYLRFFHNCTPTVSFSFFSDFLELVTHCWSVDAVKYVAFEAAWQHLNFTGTFHTAHWARQRRWKKTALLLQPARNSASGQQKQRRFIWRASSRASLKLLLVCLSACRSPKQMLEVYESTTSRNIGQNRIHRTKFLKPKNLYH